MKRRILTLIIISLISCKQKEKKQIEPPSYFDQRDEIILQAQNSDLKSKLLLDFYVDMTRKEFNKKATTAIKE